MPQSLVRRLPAVRAHHLKRMPRAIVDLNDASDLNFTLTGPVTFTQVTVVPASTTATELSPSIVSSSISPSVSHSSSSLSSTSSSSTSSTSPNPSPSSSGTSGSNTVISLIPAVTAVDSAPTSSDVPSKVAKKGFPSGAIAGIVVVVVLAALGLAFFFTRKRFIRNRKRRRPAWGAPIMNMPDASRGVGVLPDHVSHEQLSRVALPPMSYNNPTSTMATAGKGPTATRARGSATVKSTFIPTLPDELSLTIGEMLRVLNEYDDGWALCANRTGEQGMVPLDCLDLCDSDGMQDHRLSRRASSLAPVRF